MAKQNFWASYKNMKGFKKMFGIPPAEKVFCDMILFDSKFSMFGTTNHVILET